ncbi:MAG TPA: hypothetical protein VJZ49_00320 [Syntrophales bacterium]|nr:hypothetical protein [Syntrophales bacterium]
MSKPLSYLRVFADKTGESHAEWLDLQMSTKAFAPPAPPLDVSDPAKASTVTMLRLAPDWHGEWHPTPAKQWLFFLRGEANVQVSDGTSCSLHTGSIVLLEDTTGKGHQTTVRGADVVITASVQVPVPE